MPAQVKGGQGAGSSADLLLLQGCRGLAETVQASPVSVFVWPLGLEGDGEGGWKNSHVRGRLPMCARSSCEGSRGTLWEQTRRR